MSHVPEYTKKKKKKPDITQRFFNFFYHDCIMVGLHTYIYAQMTGKPLQRGASTVYSFLQPTRTLVSRGSETGVLVGCKKRKHEPGGQPPRVHVANTY